MPYQIVVNLYIHWDSSGEEGHGQSSVCDTKEILSVIQLTEYIDMLCSFVSMMGEENRSIS